MEASIKLNKLKNLADSFLAKEELHSKKRSRARLGKNYYKHKEKVSTYRNAFDRVLEIGHIIRFEKKAFKPGAIYYGSPAYQAQKEYEYRLQRKATKKLEFETKHRFSIWFMQASLGADYGKFKCDRCSNTFYHSPSTISLGIKKIYDCCCGNCTNSIIYKDWGKEPYS